MVMEKRVKAEKGRIRRKEGGRLSQNISHPERASKQSQTIGPCATKSQIPICMRLCAHAFFNVLAFDCAQTSECESIWACVDP